MATGTPTISTHVLDVGSGRPGVGVQVHLARLVGPVPVPVGQDATNDDGRIPDLLGGKALEAGEYRLTFDVDDGGFFRTLAIDFRVSDASRSYHVPLVRAPFSLSTYRGS